MSTPRRGAHQHPSPAERDAARRYLEHDHASEHLSGSAARTANQHATEIDENHPRARDIALTGTARELGELPSHLRRHQREARARAGISTEQAASIRREYRSRPAEHDDGDTQPPVESEPRRERVRSSVSRSASSAGGVLSSAAGAAADTTTGDLISEIFMAGLGLSLFYLVITHAAGVGNLFKGATNAARVVISPRLDPLNPKGALA